jgi:hypothetical protein
MVRKGMVRKGVVRKGVVRKGIVRKGIAREGEHRIWGITRAMSVMSVLWHRSVWR